MALFPDLATELVIVRHEIESLEFERMERELSAAAQERYGHLCRREAQLLQARRRLGGVPA